jgi:hypothetical protein
VPRVLGHSSKRGTANRSRRSRRGRGLSPCRRIRCSRGGRAGRDVPPAAALHTTSSPNNPLVSNGPHVTTHTVRARISAQRGTLVELTLGPRGSVFRVKRTTRPSGRSTLERPAQDNWSHSLKFWPHRKRGRVHRGRREQCETGVEPLRVDRPPFVGEILLANVPLSSQGCR